jgi:3-oxoadipate enol-lactonase
MELALRSRLTRRLTHRNICRMVAGNERVEPWLPWLFAEMSRGDPVALTDAGRALSRYDARPYAHTVDVPAGVLFTTADQLVRADKQLALARALQAEVLEVDGDHFCAWGAPEPFAKTVRALVDGVVSRLPGVPA